MVNNPWLKVARTLGVEQHADLLRAVYTAGRSTGIKQSAIQVDRLSPTGSRYVAQCVRDLDMAGPGPVALEADDLTVAEVQRAVRTVLGPLEVWG